MLTLADALEALTNVRPIATTVITEAVIDSRQVIPGSLFVAIPGEKADGHDFIEEAFRRWASFALIQRDVTGTFRTIDLRAVLSVDSFTAGDLVPRRFSRGAGRGGAGNKRGREKIDDRFHGMPPAQTQVRVGGKSNIAPRIYQRR